MPNIFETPKDVCIIGGGLAGLSLSIGLAQKGFKVVLLEKKSYPYHKVCGEYISLESWDYLENLGVPLASLGIPIIQKLKLTSTYASTLLTNLPLGGFGISRYLLDETLYKLALENGVEVLTNCTCLGYIKKQDSYEVNTSQNKIFAKFVVASFGKIGVKDFYNIKPTTGNYVGIKYHIQHNAPLNEIALHTFKGGYAGISAVEKNTYCLCYLVKADALKHFNGNIKALEYEILFKNKHLKEIFENATFLWDKPQVISNIYFGIRTLIHDNVLYLGDSAGAIPPLCGNGMSMALRSASFATPLITNYLNKIITFQQLQNAYTKQWKKHFNLRIKVGLVLQNVFLNVYNFHLGIRILKFLPFIHKPLIRLTHGKKIT